MRFSLSDLDAFVAVAERASFSKAAEQVHVSQPALSRRIGKLEDALSVRLFDRGKRPVDLTTVGRDFATKARTLLDELEFQTIAGPEHCAVAVTCGLRCVTSVMSCMAEFRSPAEQVEGFLARHAANRLCEACSPLIERPVPPPGGNSLHPRAPVRY